MKPMNRCVECKGTEFRDVLNPIERTIAGHTFKGKLPAEKCTSCGEVYIEGPAGEAFDLAVAAELARAGETAGEALAFMRKAVGLSGIELAELFDLTLGTVSRLEHGKAPPDRRTVALLAALVKDQAAGRDGMLATLRSLQRPRRLGKSVKVAVR